MKRVYKYEIRIGEQVLSLPGVGKILCVGTQNDKPHMWIEIEMDGIRTEQKHLIVMTTGATFPEDLEPYMVYVGSFMLLNGSFVGHLYEIVGK